MHPLVGLTLGGQTLTPFDDLVGGGGALGRPVWGPEQLLRDLELRLGLPAPGTSEALRTVHWAARMDELAGADVFYTRSFELDRLGTARAVLDLRDSLVEAGWDGTAVPNGGHRLTTLARLEALAGRPLAPGFADRLVAVALQLDGVARQLDGVAVRVYAPLPRARRVRDVTLRLDDAAVRLYTCITLADPIGCWSASWRRVFNQLEAAGTSFEELSVDQPGAPPSSDLGKVQAVLRSVGASAVTLRDGATLDDVRLQGDRSLLLLTAETAVEAASAAAAWIDATPAGECVVIREDDESTLEHAFFTRGMPAQGLDSVSPWRAVVQVLPLALELAFEPKDPGRVVELLGLPNGPFAGAAARHLMRALARAPGIGGRPWIEAKQRLHQLHPRALLRVTEWVEWLESAGADPALGATKEELLATIVRVRQWLVEQLKSESTDRMLLAAHRHCAELVEVLEADQRQRLDPVAVTRLLELVIGSGERIALLVESAGRVDHVSSANALWSARKTVIWWPFTHHYEPANAVSWRSGELRALQGVGVRFPEPELLLAERARGWRRAVLAATERLILVVPRSRAGHACSPHPLWDEIVVRAELDDASRARVTSSVAELLRRSPPELTLAHLPPLALPLGHSQWSVDAGLVPVLESHSPHSLSRWLGCPLQWGLASLAGIECEGTGLPAMHQLSGTLAHRLIEELHAAAAFGQTAAAFAGRAGEIIDGLIEREGAVLLRPGKGNERLQLKQQLATAALALKRSLEDNGLRLVSVEESFDVPWQSRRLKGRLDLLAEDDHGHRFIIDLKWGKNSYAQLLKAGTGVQLAAYAFAYSSEGRMPTAYYFSMKQARPLALAESRIVGSESVDGPGLQETWRRVERTLPLVERTVHSGALPVVGVRSARPLLEVVGVAPEHAPNYLVHDAAKTCEYCPFDSICGRRWEQVS